MSTSSRITLSLISHTNVGKTTLARTLLRKDVGEVFDQAHVTDVSEAHVLFTAEDGAELMLWDTPGFGDSARLWKRIKQSESAVNKFVHGIWDKMADRPFWCSQQAIMNVRDEADVVLYLANAAEEPTEAGYVAPEMEILKWLGKPVIVLLNQMGPPRPVDLERKDIENWRAYLEETGVTHTVISFDAFARCWVQEEALLRLVRDLLPKESQPMMKRLIEAWRQKNFDIFRQSMRALADCLNAIAADREPLPEANFLEKVLKPLPTGFMGPEKRAMTALGERLVRHLCQAMDALIRLHGLSGSAAQEIEQRFEDDFAVTRPLDKGMAATIGGFLTGALGGLVADIFAGGLTFGGGALVGGLLGAAGGVLAAESYNLIKGERKSYVQWSPQFAESLVESMLLRYLAVAHFGRGRGEWTSSEHPRFWKEMVAYTTAPLKADILEKLRRANANGNTSERLDLLLQSIVTDVLKELYPRANL